MEQNIESLTIETITTVAGSGVSFCPKRGGIITSLKLQGTEILYFDQATFEDRTKSVRGGIPILFPNVGALNDMRYPRLAQHGFARERASWLFEKNESGFIESLLSDTDSRAFYPYDFKLSVSAEIDDNSCTISQIVENKEPSMSLPIAMGLHPYFKVPHDQKKDIRFNFQSQYIESNIDVWGNGGTISVDNPKLVDPSAVLEISIPELGTLVFDASIHYEKIWIWSLPDKDFICIEPVMRDVGGFIDDPVVVGPLQTLVASIRLSLQK